MVREKKKSILLQASRAKNTQLNCIVVVAPGKQHNDFVSSHLMLCPYLNKTEP